MPGWPPSWGWSHSLVRSPWLVSPCLSPPLRSLFACQLFSIITASCAPSTCFVSPCGLQLAWPGAADDARPTLASFRNPEGGRFCCAGLSVLASVTEAPDRQRGSRRVGGSQRGESLHGYVSLSRRSMEAGMEAGVLGAEVCATLFSCPRRRTVPAGSGGLCSRRCRRSYAHGRSLLLAPSPPARPATAAQQASLRTSTGLQQHSAKANGLRITRTIIRSFKSDRDVKTSGSWASAPGDCPPNGCTSLHQNPTAKE